MSAPDDRRLKPRASDRQPHQTFSEKYVDEHYYADNISNRNCTVKGFDYAYHWGDLDARVFAHRGWGNVSYDKPKIVKFISVKSEFKIPADVKRKMTAHVFKRMNELRGYKNVFFFTGKEWNINNFESDINGKTNQDQLLLPEKRFVDYIITGNPRMDTTGY